MANEATMAWVEAARADDWSVVVPEEGWTVAVVCRHIAQGYVDMARWLGEMANGDGVRDTAADVDERNVVNARAWSEVTRGEVITLLAGNAVQLADVLGALRDADLEQRAPFGPAGGAVFAVAELAQQAAQHPQVHLAHAKAAVSALG